MDTNLEPLETAAKTLVTELVESKATYSVYFPGGGYVVKAMTVETYNADNAVNMYNNIIRDRIRTLISRESGTAPLISTMRWDSIARKVYALQGGDPDTKKGKNDLKFLTVEYVVNLNITDEQWIDLFEHVVRQSAKQM